MIILTARNANCLVKVVPKGRLHNSSAGRNELIIGYKKAKDDFYFSYFIFYFFIASSA